MTILDLPVELFQAILHHAIRYRGMKRGIRLRLVNKIFEKEVIEALFNFRLLDLYFNSMPDGKDSRVPPFAASYLEYRIMNEPEGGLPGLLHIRAISRQLSLESIGTSNPEDVRTFVHKLCCAMIPKMGYRVSRLFFWTRHPQLTFDFGSDLFVAAVYTNTAAAIEKRNDRSNEDRNGGFGTYNSTSDFFGSARAYAIEFGNTAVLTRPLNHPTRRSEIGWMLKLREVAKIGSLECVKHMYGLGLAWCFFEDHNYPSCLRLESLFMAPITPNVEIWDFIMNRRERHLRDPELDLQRSNVALEQIARRGWTEMASHLISLGAHVDSVSPGLGPRPIISACENGDIEMVKILLENGASTEGAVEVASQRGHLRIVGALLEREPSIGSALEKATAGGYRDIVELLLEHGREMNKDVSDLLPRVIELEHKQLFQLLMDRGLDPEQSIRNECVERARDLGLESMLDLLQCQGWAT